MLKTKRQSGFTLIELLVVVAIIGMLTSVIMVSFGHTRMRSRDTKRLSAVPQIRSGMELFESTAGGYPDPAIWLTGSVSCNGTTYLQVPVDPLPAHSFTYHADSVAGPGCGGNLYRRYYVSFTTESETELGPGGTYYITPAGVSSSAPF